MDPWEGDVTKPQTLNKYAYASNNPLLYIDPAGLRLVISDAYGGEFVTNTFQSLRQIYPELHLKQVQGGYEVKVDSWDNFKSWFSDDGSSLELMKQVIDDENTATIHQSNGGNEAHPVNSKDASNGKGTDVSVYYNPGGYNVRVYDGLGME